MEASLRAAPHPSLCPQNVERLLETIGIKVGCLGAGSGGRWEPHRVSRAHLAEREAWVAVGTDPVSPTPCYHSDVCPAGDRGDLG